MKIIASSERTDDKRREPKWWVVPVIALFVCVISPVIGLVATVVALPLLALRRVDRRTLIALGVIASATFLFLAFAFVAFEGGVGSK